MNKNKAKGNQGHILTKKLLNGLGWSVYVAPHQETVFRPRFGSYEFRKTGSNDIYAVPMLNTPTKKEGGFDIIANKTDACGKCISTFWQVKKTKRNPIVNKLMGMTRRSAIEHNLPLKSCFVIHWPDGVGITRGVPRIWRCDDQFFEVSAIELKKILEANV